MTEEPAPDPDKPERVAQLRDAVRARLCQMGLEAAGIQAFVSSLNLAWVAPDLGVALGVDVMVRQSDAAEAREVIAAMEAGTLSLPTDPTDAATCPRCGSVETQFLAKPDRVGAVVGTILVGLPRPDVRWFWRCGKCGNEWR